MNKVIRAIENIKNGKMVIVVDHEDRENEGDFIISAEKATPKDINFISVCTPDFLEYLYSKPFKKHCFYNSKHVLGRENSLFFLACGGLIQ